MRESSSTLLALLEPAVYITILASSLYFAGWSFEETYFARFSLPPSYLHFEVPHYLVRGLPTTLTAVAILLCSVLGVGQPPYSAMRSLSGNAVLFILALALVLRGLEPPFYNGLASNSTEALFFIGIGLLLFSLSLISSIRRQSLASYFWEASRERRVGVLLLTVFLSGFLAEIYANVKAGRVFRGRAKSVYVEFVPKTNSAASSLIAQKQFVLIQHYDDQYYVLPKSSAMNTKQPVIVIPQDEIALVKVLGHGGSESTKTYNPEPQPDGTATRRRRLGS